MNYNEKINELRAELEKKENVIGIIESLERNMQWDTMHRSDEADENGEYTFTAPAEDEWGYDKYVAYKEVIELIGKHYFK